MKHQDRIKAEKAYKAALTAAKKAESISESAYDKAYATLEIARKHLTQMEIKWPTNQEVRKNNEYLYLANRGLA